MTMKEHTSEQYPRERSNALFSKLKALRLALNAISNRAELISTGWDINGFTFAQYKEHMEGVELHLCELTPDMTTEAIEGITRESVELYVAILIQIGSAYKQGGYQ
jgi:hypothetical protein